MKTGHRQHLLAVVAIGALALLAADYLVRAPLYRSWQSRSARLAELRKSVTQGEILLERDTAIRARWQSMRTNALSPEPSAAENQVLKAFDRWSQESRVGINAIKPQWKRAEKDHTTLECRVDAFGNLSTLARFLYLVERDPLALKIESVEISTRDDNGEQLTLGLQVSGLVLNPQGTR